MDLFEFNAKNASEITKFAFENVHLIHIPCVFPLKISHDGWILKIYSNFEQKMDSKW